MKIKFRKKQSDIDTDDNYVKIPLILYIDKDYYEKVMYVCKQEGITFGELLNDALGDYMSLMDMYEQQKRLQEEFNKLKNSSDNKKTMRKKEKIKRGQG